ncbi:MAG: winged helix-turn-helix domain-containing protein [Lachnospiraceae bacterium]
MEFTLTNRQARQFILLKHGLLGDHKFIGKSGALEFIRQSGCIQFDPIDACGRNADLVLQSRVKKYHKNLLDELLYADRLLVDYPDKNLAIIPVEFWPYFERYRHISRKNALKYPDMEKLTAQVQAHIMEHGAICSDELKLEGDFVWHSAIHWSSGKNLTRSVLEQMYSTGDLIVHHKKGTRKYYDLASLHIDCQLLQAKDPLPNDFDHQKWRVLRRIGAVGMIWNRSSDAWLNIAGLNAENRNQIFAELLSENKITKINVEGIKEPLYCRSENLPLMEQVLLTNNTYRKRCELIAPLDNLIWDRKLLKALFNFHYTWEIYTPADKREYGYYVLPLLYGDEFVGRVEAVSDHKTRLLMVKNLWLEDGVRYTKKMNTAVEACLRRLAAFNDCGEVVRG